MVIVEDRITRAVHMTESKGQTRTEYLSHPLELTVDCMHPSLHKKSCTQLIATFTSAAMFSVKRTHNDSSGGNVLVGGDVESGVFARLVAEHCASCLSVDRCAFADEMVAGRLWRKKVLLWRTHEFVTAETATFEAAPLPFTARASHNKDLSDRSIRTTETTSECKTLPERWDGIASFAVCCAYLCRHCDVFLRENRFSAYPKKLSYSNSCGAKTKHTLNKMFLYKSDSHDHYLKK